MQQPAMRLALVASASLMLFPYTQAQAQSQTGTNNYQEPSRGIILERGTVAGDKVASIDLATGAEEQDTSGGLRLGLYFGEVILNSNLSGGGANEAAVKISLPELQLREDIEFDWAAYVGLAHIDIDDGTDYTNFLVGASATLETQGFQFTFNPEWEHADDPRDDEILNLGFGFGYTFPETRAGKFQPNFEYNVVIGGEEVNGEETDGDDYAFGVRWMYNSQLTLDLAILVQENDRDAVSLPGYARLNFQF